MKQLKLEQKVYDLKFGHGVVVEVEMHKTFCYDVRFIDEAGKPKFVRFDKDGVDSGFRTLFDEVKKNYYSPRGEQLVFIGEPMDVPVITVENYTKWYTLFTIQPDGKVEPLIIDGWIDHNPIPVEVYKYAQQANMFVDEQSMEMIIGRFVQEKYESASKERIYLEDSDNLCSYRG